MSEEVHLEEDAAARQAFMLNQLKNAVNSQPFSESEDQSEEKQPSPE